MPRGSEAPRARSAASAPGVDEPASPRPRLRADGRRIDVRFRDTELSNALRLLADAADLQLVVDDAVTGRVDLTLRGVTAAEALRIVAVAHGARVEHHGDVVVVRPP
jgi:type IV pilus assembly protein PilQ